MTRDLACPYTMEEPPTSTGRVLLSRAFAHWCMLHHGELPEQVAAALDQDGGREVAQVRFAARLLGELMAAGDIRTFVRPFGAGSPAPLARTSWERDDFRPLFARSAIDPSRPFDADVEPTHWIFLDLEDFNRVVDLSCADIPRPVTPAATEVAADGSSTGPAPGEGGNHVRMPELERRTGLSRATIYRRIEQGRFPRQITMDGNIASWWERDVAEWLANPR